MPPHALVYLDFAGCSYLGRFQTDYSFDKSVQSSAPGALMSGDMPWVVSKQAASKLCT